VETAVADVNLTGATTNVVGDYTHVGVAVYQTASGELWVAINFAKV
jgi:uncharacterized protein YkwD